MCLTALHSNKSSVHNTALASWKSGRRIEEASNVGLTEAQSYYCVHYYPCIPRIAMLQIGPKGLKNLIGQVLVSGPLGH